MMHLLGTVTPYLARGICDDKCRWLIENVVSESQDSHPHALIA